MDKKFWQSKKFITALVGIVAMVIIGLVPELANSESEMVDNVTYIVMLAIAGFTFQDIGILWLQKPRSIQLVREGVQYGLDAFEKATGKDIPDNLEKVVVDEVGNAASQLAGKPQKTVDLDALHFDPAVNNEWLSLTENAKG